MIFPDFVGRKKYYHPSIHPPERCLVPMFYIIAFATFSENYSKCGSTEWGLELKLSSQVTYAYTDLKISVGHGHCPTHS